MNTEWMTKQEAAAHLRVSPVTLDRYVREGLVTKYVIGSKQSPRFRRTELDAIVTPAGDGPDTEDNPDAA